MKTVALLLVCISCTTVASADLDCISCFDGKWTWWYENGQLELEGNYVNGERDGKWTLWYENGQKCIETYFLNGVMGSTWSQWHENGQERLDKSISGCWKEPAPLSI